MFTWQAGRWVAFEETASTRSRAGPERPGADGFAVGDPGTVGQVRFRAGPGLWLADHLKT
ncbi:hypothetical protein [Kitasatospora phosalacinea]|uniref:Uncharacterized protein n=1 Tax=Kitasatospora phosalacinea TaxID=2065 RepID=A0A9W6PJK7_9ACTN|nr:hypothetical protein [Kitasatospora phosalacinea]GLW57455.1 hypothetical protein Kpho01_54660 [Kitasatospora phosalacinea]